MSKTYRDEVDRISRLLTDAWAKAEPEHPIARYPDSYTSTFVEMARAVVDDREKASRDVWHRLERIAEQLLGLDALVKKQGE